MLSCKVVKASLSMLKAHRKAPRTMLRGHMWDVRCGTDMWEWPAPSQGSTEVM